MWTPYPQWLNPGDNAWQMTAATLVGLMSVPGLVVLYGGVMQKRWSVNSMMLAFAGFAVVLLAWVLYGFHLAFGQPMHIFGVSHGFLANIWGKPADVLGHIGEQGQASIPLITTGPPFHFPMATLVYFQFVFAGITPLLMLGSVLGRFNFRAWIPFVLLWSSLIYTVNAFAIWGGGWFAQHGALDYSGGYVIHLAAGVSGFVAAAVVGPRLQRDREVDAPNNLLMVATGAGLLWLGWNGFNGGDPYYAGASASAAVLNTNVACATAFLAWVGLDYLTRRKPTLIGSVNGMITGLIGAIVVYLALNYLSRVRPFRNVDDTLGVIYTHGFAGLTGGLLTGVLADPGMVIYPGIGKTPSIAPLAGLVHGSAHLLKEQVWAALWIIGFSAIGTFIILKLVGLVVSLRMTDEDIEEGDLAVHGHEVYPSDVPSLSFPSGAPGLTAPPAGTAPAGVPRS
jgi:Amt family ammonium transporter